MSLRRSTRTKKTEESKLIDFDSLSKSSSSSSKLKSRTLKRSSKPYSKKASYRAKKEDTPEIDESIASQAITQKPNKAKSIKSNKSAASKRATKAISRIDSSSSEKVLTPPTPEITLDMLKEKPWLSEEFLLLVLEELKTSSTVSKENPKMLSLVGPMAAGKSTVKHQLHFDDAVNLDVDEVRIIATREFGKKAHGIFVDFGKIIQLLGVIIINNNYDFILDTTGKMKEPIKYIMKKAKEADYTIDIAIVYSTRDLCERRAEHRNITYTAREPVPIPVVGKVYDEFKESKRGKSYIMGIKDIVDMTDNLYLFDNSRCTPKAALIMERHGKDITVHEDFPDFYGVSVSQLSPKLVAHGIKKTRKNKKIHRKTRKH